MSEAKAEADKAGADEARPAEQPDRPPSHRIRTCAASVSSFVTALFAACAPEEKPQRAVRLDAEGRRLGPDGKPIRIPRKLRVALEGRKAQEAAREKLLALKINLNSGPLQYLSPVRLSEYEKRLDDFMRHILVKTGEASAEAAEATTEFERATMQLLEAPKSQVMVALQEKEAAEKKFKESFERNEKWSTAAYALAADVLRLCAAQADAQVALPWPTKKGKGNKQPGQVALRVRELAYTPDAGTGRREGVLQLSVQVDGQPLRWVKVSKCATTLGADNNLDVMCPEGNLLLEFVDEPTRWTWFLAINAGLHRAGTGRVMLDQPALSMQLHGAVRVDPAE